MTDFDARDGDPAELVGNPALVRNRQMKWCDEHECDGHCAGNCDCGCSACSETVRQKNLNYMKSK